MRKSTKFLGSLAVAGLVAASGSAFAAANTYTNATKIVGYGEQTTTGIVVSSVLYTARPADNSMLSNVVFTTTTDTATGFLSTMVLKTTADAVVGTVVTCTPGGAGPFTITCDIDSQNVMFSTFQKTGLTVIETG